MRTNWHHSALPLSIVLALGCSTGKEQPAPLADDLKQDLAVASASAGDLAIAPQSYQRMRFVSGVEQLPSAAPAKRPKAAHKVTRTRAPHRSTSVATTAPIPDPVATIADESPAPAEAIDPVEPEAPTVVAQSPVSGPSSEPASSAGGSSAQGAGNRGHGGGWGAVLGGIIGSVVIRGGAGGIDHCDPRHDGSARPTMPRRPDLGMPVYGGGVFAGGRRR